MNARIVTALIAAVVSAAAAFTTTLAPAPAAAQATTCQRTSEGLVCKQSQPIVKGVVVNSDDQKALGLVTVGGGCSGTLLNQRWVLTARHCVAVNNDPTQPLQPAGNIAITADWAPGVSATATKLHDFAANRMSPSFATDIVLIYLGAGNLGAVNGHRPLVEQVSTAPPSSWTARRISNDFVLTQYGRGFGTLATSLADLAKDAGIYRSATLEASGITRTGYDFAPNGSEQVGQGGDSGGPTYVFDGAGREIGIAGVQSTCDADFLPGAPGAAVPGGPPNWQYATKVRSCHYISVEPFVREIAETIAEGPRFAMQPTSFYQVRADGNVWGFLGADCRNGGCPGWTQLDNSGRTVMLAAADQSLYQLRRGGEVLMATGEACAPGGACSGWILIANDPNTIAIVAAGKKLYRLKRDGAIWRWEGKACEGYFCSSWTVLDRNPNTVQIVADAEGDALYQRHRTGAIWRFTGTPCSSAGCPGWQLMDNNPAARQIAAADGVLYELHAGTGAIWRSTGRPCDNTGCPGWVKIDENPRTAQIYPVVGALYQRHEGGVIWRFTGQVCSNGRCPGWTMVDNNPLTTQLSAGQGGTMLGHSDGSIWRNTRNGWVQIDMGAVNAKLFAAQF